ncbi:MAG: SDR family NAD(P)-dependent oxidoreductase [Bacilli bacterium]|nr:SDR family NAD(P)-dependent oxidoreductase [Bacilli bacterium]
MKKKITNYLDKLHSLEGKKIIITGANSGVGFSIAKECLYKGCKSIVLACRNETRANNAKNQLAKDYPDSKIDIILYNQENLESDKSFVDDIFKYHSNFDYLVLNAGVFNAKKGKQNEYGFPVVSGVNTFGLLAILKQLEIYLPNIDKETRIVIQGSLGIHFARYKNIEKSLLNPNKNHFYQYFNSKIADANLFHFYSINNQNPHVKFLMCEPGIAASNIIRNYPKWFIPIANGFIKTVFQTSDMGALSCMYLLTNYVSNGEYYRPSRIFGYKGYPKKAYLNKKIIKSSMIDEMTNCLNN